MPPWLQTLGRWRCQPAPWRGLGKILWGGEIQRVITTDAVGAFAELPLPADALLVWHPAEDPGTLEPLIAALPPQTLWSHLTALDPGRGRQSAGMLAQRLGRPASWWLPGIWCPSRRPTRASGDSRPWEPSRLPRPLLALCADLVESNQGPVGRGVRPGARLARRLADGLPATSRKRFSRLEGGGIKS